jgi:hypothetical protein
MPFIPPNKNGNLYYVRLNTPAGILYKIGFTTKASVHERLAYNGNGDETMIEKVIFCFYLEDAFDVECQLHEFFKDQTAYLRNYSHKVAPLHKNGQTELYRSDVLKLDTDYTSSEAAYRREGMSEDDILKALKQQKLIEGVLLSFIWLPIKLFAGILWLYEKLSKTEFFERGRQREANLKQLLDKINDARLLAERQERINRRKQRERDDAAAAVRSDHQRMLRQP